MSEIVYDRNEAIKSNKLIKAVLNCEYSHC